MQIIRFSDYPFNHRNFKASCSSRIPKIQQQYRHFLLSTSTWPIKPLYKSRIPSFSPQCAASSSSSSSSPTPPATKEEAILQAKIALSSTLEKPLNNPKLAGKLKKLKQPKLRVEIPVIDDSPSSLTQLALDVFGSMPIRRKGSKIKILIFWQGNSLTKAATEAFKSNSMNVLVENRDMESVNEADRRTFSSADVAVFLAPETSDVAVMESITDSLYPKPVVIFNPKWTFEEEGDFVELRSFVGSFDVVYSFMGLEVQGILSKKRGVIFKCVRDGVLSGERWNILVEEEGGEMKAVSSFKARPSLSEVENVLYNLMAMNSPITKSLKFLKDLVSNATGKK